MRTPTTPIRHFLDPSSRQGRNADQTQVQSSSKRFSSESYAFPGNECIVETDSFIHASLSVDSYNSKSTKPLFRATQIIWSLLVILEVFMAFRLVLKLLAANTGAGFTQFIYGVTWPFVIPFLTVFGTTRVEGSIFEWSTLLAMFVYALIGVGIVKLLTMSKTVSTPEAAAKLDENETV